MKRCHLPLVIFVAAVSARAHAVDLSDAERALARTKELIFVAPERAIVAADAIKREAIRNASDSRSQLIAASASRLKSEAALRVGSVNLARDEITEAAAIVAHLAPRSTKMADVLLTRGAVYAQSGKVAFALRDYQNAFRYYQSAGDGRSQVVSLVDIAILYSDAKDNDSALRYLDQASEVPISDLRLKAAIFNSKGGILQDVSRFRQADAAFLPALSATQRLGDIFFQAQILGNIARNRLKAGDLDGADRALSRAMALTRSGEAATWRPQVEAIAAEAALRRGRTPLAGRLIDQSFRGVDLGATTLSSREAHDTAYRVYAKLGRTGDALAHLVALKRLDDEATKLATSTSTALMGARFDFANQELRIARLRAEELRRSVAAEQAQARFERMLFAVAAGAVAAIIGLLAWALVTVKRGRDRERFAKDGLARTNAALGKALAAKTEFLATTSHEIRTPLNGILGMTQVMLADRALADDVRERLGVVHQAGTTMRALVDDILDAAKVEKGGLEIERTPFDLCDTLAAAARLWEAQARAKGLAFRSETGGCPAVILGDAARVRQIVHNLLANAVKFTAEGGVTLRAQADPGAGVVTVAVSDTGIGVAPHQRDAIFEAFRQADASTTRRFGGTGLGLSIARSLAEAMGGALSVDSVEGRGSTFTLRLPLVEAVRPAEREDAAPAAATLLIEPNPIFRAMYRTLLKDEFGEITTAADADEALAAAASGGIRRVLATADGIDADIGRAVMLAAALRDHGVRVVFLWPAGREADGRLLMAAGAAAVLEKPVAAAAIVSALAGEARVRPLVSQAA